MSIERDALATLMPGFEGFTAPAWLAEAFNAGLESACIYGSNVQDREQLRSLGRELRAIAPTAILAIDEEGGEVTRLSYLEGSPYPGAAVMGRIDDESYSEQIGRRVAREILTAGFNLALGPVADVNSNPMNPVIGTRSFGATSGLAARHVAAWVRGLEGQGAIACPKHFPGHGDTGEDSHLALPSVSADAALLAQRDLPPFSAAFAAGARTVMTSHIVLTEIDPAQPATFSSRILQDMLRGELGFTGVIVSDALDMKGASGEIGIPEAAVRAISAGCDLLCVGVDMTAEDVREIVAHLTQAVADGRLSRERLADAATRVRALAGQAQVAPGVAGSADGAMPRELVTEQEIGRVVRSFDGVDDARAWLEAHRGAQIFRVDSEANMAVGFAPWGPFAAAAHPFPGGEAAAQAFAARAEHNPVAAEGELKQPLIVIGREIHRLAPVTQHIDALTAAGTPVLVVEMGWPAGEAVRHENRADLRTYGSSALVGQALLDLVAHPERFTS